MRRQESTLGVSLEPGLEGHVVGPGQEELAAGSCSLLVRVDELEWQNSRGVPQVLVCHILVPEAAVHPPPTPAAQGAEVEPQQRSHSPASPVPPATRVPPPQTCPLSSSHP